ncbi:hypothetical protein HPB48_013073 [Haemaphysalis longicornis]|uniref:beta-N-acetylhexosaminidase n=1 Tax=Haemaphysalis longicornis TaxID=44386 RepID=A0A9J6G2F3_HAELO|nr:hypothetical protein HPB48_013073 [Haemaphysalis longicornis]
MERYRDRLIFGGCVAHHSNDAWPARLRHLTRIGLAKRGTTKTPASATGAWMGALNIKLTNRCEDMPHADMDETYRLVLTSSGPSTLTARSAWGVIRGLESFSQLVQRYNCHSRVFRWSAQLFPQGAFNPKTHVYRASDVARVVREAADRGIRVVPEFDSPGHTKSWGKAFPGLVAKCEEKVGHSVRKAGLLNPSKTATFTFLARLLAEVARIFPDEYIHLGETCLSWSADAFHYVGSWEKLYLCDPEDFPGMLSLLSRH